MYSGIKDIPSVISYEELAQIIPVVLLFKNNIINFLETYNDSFWITHPFLLLLTANLILVNCQNHPLQVF